MVTAIAVKTFKLTMFILKSVDEGIDLKVNSINDLTHEISTLKHFYATMMDCFFMSMAVEISETIGTRLC